MISSDFEGSPNSVKECMCCNTPVVSTPVGNVPEMIGDIPGAYVTKGFTAEELAECCDKVLRSTQQFKGREEFLAKGYGMATVAEKLKDIYMSILER
jgi:glycosyltransferase involved in cell wall biosynthesis